MLPSSVVEAVETVLKSQDGVMKKWGQVQEILLGAKLAYQQVFPPCLFMVHPLNRGGTGVNPYSCHRKGGAIVQGGICFLRFVLIQLVFEVGSSLSAESPMVHVRTVDYH